MAANLPVGFIQPREGVVNGRVQIFNGEEIPVPEEIPPPPPGFVLNEEIPPPPAGFVLNDDIPPPPPGFILNGTKAPAQPQDSSLWDLAKRGFQYGVEGAKSLYHSAETELEGFRQGSLEKKIQDPAQQEWAGRTLTASKAAQTRAVKDIQANQQKMSELRGKDIGDFSDIDSVSAAANWAAFSVPQGLIYMAPAVVAGATGGPVGLGAFGLAMGKADLVNNRIENVMEKFGKDFNASPAQMAALNAELNDTRQLTNALAIPYAAMELLGPAAKIARGGFAKPALEAMTADLMKSGYLKAFLKEAGKGSLGEYVNEFGQEGVISLLEKIRDNTDFFTMENLKKWNNAGAVGAVSGAPLGGVGGVSQRFAASQETKQNDANEQVLQIRKRADEKRAEQLKLQLSEEEAKANAALLKGKQQELALPKPKPPGLPVIDPNLLPQDGVTAPPVEPEIPTQGDLFKKTPAGKATTTSTELFPEVNQLVREAEEATALPMDQMIPESTQPSPSALPPIDDRLLNQRPGEPKPPEATLPPLPVQLPVADLDNPVNPDFEEVVPGVTTLPLGSWLSFLDENNKLAIGRVASLRKVVENGKTTMVPTVRTQGVKGAAPTQVEIDPSRIKSSYIALKWQPEGTRVPEFLHNLKEKVRELRWFRQTGAFANELEYTKAVASLMYAGTVAQRYTAGISLPQGFITPGTGAINIQDALDWIMSSPEVGKRAPFLQRLAAVIALKVDEDLTMTAVLDAEGNLEPLTKGGSSGVYFANRHTVEVGKEGLDVAIILHELVHGITMRALYTYFSIDRKKVTRLRPEYTVDTLPPHVRELWKLFLRARSRGIDMTKDGGRQEWALAGGSMYGLSDIGEFLAEGWMNPSFQRQMMKTYYEDAPKVSIYTRFVNAVVGFLGFESADNSEFAAFVHASAKLFAEQSGRVRELGTQLAKLYPMQEWLHQLGPAVNQVTDGAVAMSNAAQEGLDLKDEADAKIDAMPKTLSKDLDWIPDDPVLDNRLIQKISLEDDGTGWANNLYPGGLLAAAIRKSTLLKTVYRFMDNAQKRARRWEHEMIQPVENVWSRVLRKNSSALKLREVFLQEMDLKEPFSEEDLRGVLSETELNAYLDLREVLNAAWQKQNDALIDIGLKPVSKLDAYMASRWHGPWRSVIRDADNNIVWVVAETTRARAEQAVAWIRKNHPTLISEEVRARRGTEHDSMLSAGYLEMLKLIDKNNPHTQHLKQAWEEAVKGTSENVLQQEKHFKRKTGVKGFAGMRPWASPIVDAKDMFVEQFKYLKGANQWSEMQRPVKEVSVLLKYPEIQIGQKNNIRLAQEYVRNHLGFGTSQAVSQLEHSLASMFGKSTEHADNIIGGMKTLFYLAALGYNFGYTIYAALQPTLSAGQHAVMTVEGHPHSVARTTFHGMVDGFGFALTHWAKMFHSWSPDNKMGQIVHKQLQKNIASGMSDIGIAAMEYMEQNGTVDINPLTEIGTLYLPASLNAARKIGGVTIAGVEQISRAMAFYGFLHHLMQDPKMDLQKALVMADDATKISMVDYRPTERAMMFEKMGLAGKAVATLQSFKFNWMSQIVLYAKMGLKDNNWRPFMMQMSAYLLLSGMLGMVGVDDADDIYQQLLKLLPADQYMKYKDWSPKSAMLRNLPDWAAYGGVGYLSGTNIFTRGSLGQVLPVRPDDSVGENLMSMAPFIGSVYDMAVGGVAGVKELMGVGNMGENYAAMYRGTPAGLKGPFEVQTGAFTAGGTSLSTADPELGVYRRDEADRQARMFGLKTLKEYKEADARYRHRRMALELDKRRGAASKSYVSALLGNDTPRALQQLETFAELGGDPKNLIAAGRLTEAVKRKTLTYAEQLAVKAKPGNRAAILNLIAWLESYQPTK